MKSETCIIGSLVQSFFYLLVANKAEQAIIAAAFKRLVIMFLEMS
jgi:hypothetical protein